MRPLTRNDTAFQGYAVPVSRGGYKNRRAAAFEVPVERDTTFLDAKRAEQWCRQMERLQASIAEVLYRPCPDCGSIDRAGAGHPCPAVGAVCAPF